MLRSMVGKAVGVVRSKSFQTRIVASYSSEADTFNDEGRDVRRSERGLNKVTLIGRIGRDPEYRGNEHPCILFPLATNLNYRKGKTGELLTKTDWHRVCVFRPGLRDKIASRVKKGDKVFVEGAITYQRLTNEENRSVNVTSIVADDIMILARKQAITQDIDTDEEQEM